MYIEAVEAATIPESFTKSVVIQPAIEAAKPLNISGYLSDIRLKCFVGLNNKAAIINIPTSLFIYKLHLSIKIIDELFCILKILLYI